MSAHAGLSRSISPSPRYPPPKAGGVTNLAGSITNLGGSITNQGGSCSCWQLPAADGNCTPTRGRSVNVVPVRKPDISPTPNAPWAKNGSQLVPHVTSVPPVSTRKTWSTPRAAPGQVAAWQYGAKCKPDADLEIIYGALLNFRREQFTMITGLKEQVDSKLSMMEMMIKQNNDIISITAPEVKEMGNQVSSITKILDRLVGELHDIRCSMAGISTQLAEDRRATESASASTCEMATCQSICIPSAECQSFSVDDELKAAPSSGVEESAKGERFCIASASRARGPVPQIQRWTPLTKESAPIFPHQVSLDIFSRSSDTHAPSAGELANSNASKIACGKRPFDKSSSATGLQIKHTLSAERPESRANCDQGQDQFSPRTSAYVTEEMKRLIHRFQTEGCQEDSQPANHEFDSSDGVLLPKLNGPMSTIPEH